ncbi:hypothetical protein [Pseudomonas chlororaphis]|uniref:hypothetical protein n=1 Tax=Pseudomonas chlororaphis TaxID=587753 RepID=UPI003D0A7D22
MHRVRFTKHRLGLCRIRLAHTCVNRINTQSLESAALQRQPFRQLNQKFLDQASTQTGGEQSVGWFLCKAQFGFAQPALSFLAIAKQRFSHCRYVRKPKHTITLAQGQALAAVVQGVGCDDLAERSRADDTFITEMFLV